MYPLGPCRHLQLSQASRLPAQHHVGNAKMQTANVSRLTSQEEASAAGQASAWASPSPPLQASPLQHRESAPDKSTDPRGSWPWSESPSQPQALGKASSSRRTGAGICGSSTCCVRLGTRAESLEPFPFLESSEVCGCVRLATQLHKCQLPRKLPEGGVSKLPQVAGGIRLHLLLPCLSCFFCFSLQGHTYTIENGKTNGTPPSQEV